jgi:hypothetical protein
VKIQKKKNMDVSRRILVIDTSVSRKRLDTYFNTEGVLSGFFSFRLEHGSSDG